MRSIKFSETEIGRLFLISSFDNSKLGLKININRTVNIPFYSSRLHNTSQRHTFQYLKCRMIPSWWIISTVPTGIRPMKKETERYFTFQVPQNAASSAIFDVYMRTRDRVATSQLRCVIQIRSRTLDIKCTRNWKIANKLIHFYRIFRNFHENPAQHQNTPTFVLKTSYGNFKKASYEGPAQED